MSRVNVPKELEEWAIQEMNYPIPGKPATNEESVFEKLCRGHLTDKWLYLSRHVRSRSTAHHIRANLVIARHRAVMRSDVTMSSSCLQPESERDELLHERRSIQKDLKRCVFKSTAAECGVKQYRQDCAVQAEAISESEHRLRGLRQSKYLLGVFLKKCQKDIKELEASVEGVKELKKHLEERVHIERAFSSDGEKDIATASQHAVAEGSRLTKELLASILDGESDNAATTQVRKDLVHLFRNVGAKQIHDEFRQETIMATKKVDTLTKRIDMHDEAKKLRSELERSGVLVDPVANPDGLVYPVQNLLVDLCRKHVRSNLRALSHKERCVEWQRRNEQQLARLDDLLKTHPPWTRRLLLRLVELEMTLGRGRAMIAFLEEEFARLGKEILRGSEAARMSTKYLHVIEEQAKLIGQKKDQIECLMTQNAEFYSKLEAAQSNVKDLISSGIIPLETPLSRALVDLRNKPSRQLTSLNSAPVQTFASTLFARKTGQRRFPTTGLSIYRLTPESSSSDEMGRILRLLADSSRQSSPLHVVKVVVDGKRWTYELNRWLGGAKSCCDVAVEKTQNNKVNNLCGQLEKHEAMQKKLLIPILDSDLERLRKAGSDANFQRIVEAWKFEEAQETVSDDERLQVKGLPLKKWQEKFRVSLARWQQQLTD